MERAVGGILGLAAFAAVAIAAFAREVPFADAAWRALAAMVLGYLAGRWLVGPAGRAVAREAAGPPQGQGPPPGGGVEPPQAA